MNLFSGESKTLNRQRKIMARLGRDKQMKGPSLEQK